MKTIDELNTHNYKTNPNIDKNLNTLFLRLNELQDAYGKDLVITSGLRSEAQQDDLIKQGKTKAKHSLHLAGCAADILDEDGSLKKWATENIKIFDVIGFWLESFNSTPNWLHVQIQPPKSGKRIFIP